MSVPGANLLNMALGLIVGQTVGYRKYLGKTTNAAGIDVVNWAPTTNVSGSLQPIDTTLMATLGLDLDKEYVTFYSVQPIGDLGRDRTSDRITYGGKTFQVISKANWVGQDGWNRVLCVEVANAQSA